MAAGSLTAASTPRNRATRALSPEQQFVVNCIRTAFGQPAESAPAELDWERVPDPAAQYGLTPVVHAAVRERPAGVRLSARPGVSRRGPAIEAARCGQPACAGRLDRTGREGRMYPSRELKTPEGVVKW